MEEKILKQFKTSCPFPLLIYRTVVKYNEVRKASGVAYILLELIEKSVGANENIADVLLRFGIPVDLHHIFANELSALLGTEIITSRYNAGIISNSKYFSQIKVGEVSLTEKGRKMFRDGAIPTGAEKAKVKDIFFDPVRRKFDVSSVVPYTKIETTCLGEDFISSVDIDISGLEDYINANPTKIGIRQEERIVSFESDEPQWMITRQEEGLTVSVNNQGVVFSFASSDENAFFNKYYSSKIMKEMMLLKAKYKFYDSSRKAVSVPTVRFEKLNASNLYIPDDINKQADRPCKIFIARNALGYERRAAAIKTDESTSKTLLNRLDGEAEFALLDNSGCRYYRALNIALPCAQFGDVFEMHFLVENQASDEQFALLMQELYKIYKAASFTDENGRVIQYVSEVLKNPFMLQEYVESKINDVKAVDEKIAVLLKVNGTFKRATEWKPIFDKLAKALYEASVKEVRLYNMIYKNTVLSPLRMEMGMSDMDYIISFSSDVKLAEEPTLVYQALDAAGFGASQILGVVNVVEVYMRSVLGGESIIADTDISTKFSAVQVNLWKLNGMLGIEDISQYTLREDYNVDEFFNAYTTFNAACKSVEKYKQYALKEFAELKRYADIFEPIHDLLSIERTASLHPDRINEKYIDEQISRGKYKDAICDLLVKLQYDLRNLLGVDSTVPANELIDMARVQGHIDGKAANSLHRLRMCRNGFQHPESSRQIQFDKAIITEWKEIVFSIGGGN